MTGHDDLERRLPDYLEGRAPTAPAGLLNDLLRQTVDLPQRRGVLTFANSAWWAVGAAVVVLVAALALRSALPGPSVPPGGQASPSPSSEPSMTTITVSSPVHEKAIIVQATDVMSARLRTLGIGNFTSSGSGDNTTFSFVLPSSVDLADVRVVLTTQGDIEWLAWSAEPWPVEGDPVRQDVLPLFDASGQILSVTVRPASDGSPEGVVVSLGSLAADAIATYTSAHIGEPAMPLAMDGVILLSPTIQGAITGGDVLITLAEDAPISAEALSAIMASGPLPAAWTASPAGSPVPLPTPSPTAETSGYFVRWQNDDDATYHVELIEDPTDDPTGAIFHPWIIGPGETGVVEIPSTRPGELQVRLLTCDAVAQWVVQPGNYEVVIHGGQATLRPDAARSSLVPMPTASTCIFSGP